MMIVCEWVSWLSILPPDKLLNYCVSSWRSKLTTTRRENVTVRRFNIKAQMHPCPFKKNRTIYPNVRLTHYTAVTVICQTRLTYKDFPGKTKTHHCAPENLTGWMTGESREEHPVWFCHTPTSCIFLFHSQLSNKSSMPNISLHLSDTTITFL